MELVGFTWRRRAGIVQCAISYISSVLGPDANAAIGRSGQSDSGGADNRRIEHALTGAPLGLSSVHPIDASVRSRRFAAAAGGIIIARRRHVLAVQRRS